MTGLDLRSHICNLEDTPLRVHGPKTIGRNLFALPNQSMEKSLTTAPASTLFHHLSLGSETSSLWILSPFSYTSQPCKITAHGACLCIHMHDLILWASRDSYLLCRHLSAPPTPNHTEIRGQQPVLKSSCQRPCHELTDITAWLEGMHQD